MLTKRFCGKHYFNFKWTDAINKIKLINRAKESPWPSVFVAIRTSRGRPKSVAIVAVTTSVSIVIAEGIIKAGVAKTIISTRIRCPWPYSTICTVAVITVIGSIWKSVAIVIGKTYSNQQKRGKNRQLKMMKVITKNKLITI